MKGKKYRGNVKDYVVLSGNMLMDYAGTYNVKRTEFETGEDVLLLHKKWLHRFISGEDAQQFWNRKLRIRARPCGNST